MKITAFNASPWGLEGHTHILVQQFLEGAVTAGAKARNIQLLQEKIRPCNRCSACFYKTPGKCVIKDDMSNLIDKFMASDVVILATPLYIDNVTALMKLFIDRLIPILEPHYEKDPDGQYRRGKRFKKYPRFVAVSTCALPEQTNFQVLRLFFRRMARTFHTELAAEIYRAGAGLLMLGKEDLRFKTVVNQYKSLLRQAGKEFVETGKIAGPTARKLEEPIIDADDYTEYANKQWDRILPKHLLKVLA